MSIYLDNAATTRLMPEAAEAMRIYFSKDFYNPSAGYSKSKKIREKLEECREIIAASINAKSEEIFFTSGGTESDNWACEEGILRNGHIITSSIEHKAVLEPLKNYVNRGGKVDFLKVDKEGLIDCYSLKRSICRRTALVSIMMANNEVGVIEPIKEIGDICGEYEVLFHTDAVQAYTHIPIDVDEAGCDMLSASSHKFNGPKGCGFIYIRKGSDVRPFIRGGGQEKGMRSGTENVPGIIGMAKAAEISCAKMKMTADYMRKVSSHMIKRILAEIPDSRINGSMTKRLPNNINVSFKDVEAQSILVLLDMNGISAAAGSACNTKSQMPSHVLTSLMVPREYIYGTIRMTIDASLTLRQADYVVDVLKNIIETLRNKAS